LPSAFDPGNPGSSAVLMKLATSWTSILPLGFAPSKIDSKEFRIAIAPALNPIFSES
jgi:hypothetical protein